MEEYMDKYEQEKCKLTILVIATLQNIFVNSEPTGKWTILQIICLAHFF
jgi:hypothetical protein